MFKWAPKWAGFLFILVWVRAKKRFMKQLSDHCHPCNGGRKFWLQINRLKICSHQLGSPVRDWAPSNRLDISHQMIYQIYPLLILESWGLMILLGCNKLLRPSPSSQTKMGYSWKQYNSDISCFFFGRGYCWFSVTFCACKAHYGWLPMLNVCTMCFLVGVEWE